MEGGADGPFLSFPLSGSVCGPVAPVSRTHGGLCSGAWAGVGSDADPRE